MKLTLPINTRNYDINSLYIQYFINNHRATLIKEGKMCKGETDHVKRLEIDQLNSNCLSIAATLIN